MVPVSINFLAVVVAAALSLVLGAIWYSPALFGKQWLKSIGKTGEDMASMRKNAAKSYAATAVASLLVAYVMARFVSYADATTLAQGAQIGFWAWLGFAATTAVGVYLFEGRKKELYLINQGYHLLEFLVLGALLAVWH